MSPRAHAHLVGSLAGGASRGLLQLLRVLEEQGVAETRAEEQVPGLHGDHLGAGQVRVRPARPGPAPGPPPETLLTLLVRTLAAALSKWKARTLRMPSVMSVST